MKRFLRENGLSIALFALFAVFLLGQSLTGHRHHNEQLEEHRVAPIGYAEYLGSGAFLSATMENWESEFLQMAVYVIFTAVLFQKGSAESKSLDEEEEVDRDPKRARVRKDAPGPVKRGGLALRLYEHSLSLAFVLLFLLSFGLHAIGGTHARNEDAAEHGSPPVSLPKYVASSQFWFESFQNWQSEFLSVGAMVVLSIFLRQRGSPESKPVDAPHCATGTG